MSLLLSIETSTSALSVALFSEDRLLEELFELPATAKHAERLLPLVDQLLKNHHVALPSITGIAFPHGPGSYTSLRVGLATVMGLIAGRALPVYAVSSLAAMAYGMRGRGKFLAPVLKAGRGLLMGAAYDGSDLSLTMPEGPYPPETFLGGIKKLKGPVAFGGPGFEALAPHVPGATQCLPWPRASHVGEYVLHAKPTPKTIGDVHLQYFMAGVEALGA